MKRLFGAIASLLILIPAGGCAPLKLTEGVGYAADRYRVRDAGALTVSSSGHLRFNTALRSDLDDAIAANDVSALRKQGADVLQRANALAIASASGEIDRMSEDGLSFLIKTYALTRARSEAAKRKEHVKRAFEAAAREALERDLAKLNSSKDAWAARWFLSDIQWRIQTAVADRGKTGRILIAGPMFIPAAIGAAAAESEAMQREMIADFKQTAEYHPAQMEDVPDAAALAKADPATLARWYAPVFVQEVDADADYPPSEDRIGRVHLTGTPDKIQVNVDIAKPVVYWTLQQAKIGTRRYSQLVYVAWYPSRPALSPNDSEAGRIDGVVVRVTLDHHKRPAIYEFVRSCGCYHTLWVSEFVEAAAREQYGPPADGKRFAVQRAGIGRELFLPELIPDDGAHPRRPAALVSAGHHLLMGVKPITDGMFNSDTANRRAYSLEPYETLTTLPLGNTVASMFGTDGLVHDAGRGEGWLLAPTGMLSAGQPRQLGTMKIRMDAYDYDDPRLLERNLRLPDDF